MQLEAYSAASSDEEEQGTGITDPVEIPVGSDQMSDRRQRQRNAAEAQKAKNKMFYFF